MSTAPHDVPALAGHGRRLAAALLDAIAYIVVIGAGGTAGFLVGLAGAATTGSSDSDYDGWEELGWVLLGTFVGAVVGFVCAIVLVVVLAQRSGPRNGQTIGKQLAGIRALRADGREVGFGFALLRELLTKWLLIWIVAGLISSVMGFADGGFAGLVVAVAIWYLPACFDDGRRALHDRMCSTRVVRASTQTAPAAPAGTADDLWPATP